MPIVVPGPVECSAETRVNRKNTTAFIRANPYPVVLIPRMKIRTPSGGSRWQDQPARPGQIMRLIPRDETTQPDFNDEGKEKLYDYVLLGEWSGSIEINDYWRDVDDFFYEVTDVQSNGYEIKGAVIKHGNR